MGAGATAQPRGMTGVKTVTGYTCGIGAALLWAVRGVSLCVFGRRAPPHGTVPSRSTARGGGHGGEGSGDGVT